jgi:hypothetical protein
VWQTFHHKQGANHQQLLLLPMPYVRACAALEDYLVNLVAGVPERFQASGAG